SYALLIFGGPLAPNLSYGVAATFVSSAILGLVVACGSSLRFAIAAPDTSTAAMTGILASSVVERMAITGAGRGACGGGCARGGRGRGIRYVPYPVVGGFLGATGCLILLGAIRVITGIRPQFSTLDQFANVLTLSELGAACVMALILYLTWHRSRSPFGL